MEEPSQKIFLSQKKKKNYNIGFGLSEFLLSKGNIINGRLFIFISKIQFFEVLFASQEKLKCASVLSFFSSIVMAIEQTKVLLFQTNIECSSSGIIFLSLKSSKFLNFVRLLLFFFLSSNIVDPKILSRNNNRNTHICTVLSREKYFIILLTKVQSEKKNICKGTSTTIFVLFELLKTLLIIRFPYLDINAYTTSFHTWLTSPHFNIPEQTKKR